MAGKKNILKVKQFTDKLLSNNLNATKAMQECNPHITSNYVINNKVHRWLSDPTVIDEIVRRMKELDISPDKTIELIRGRLIKIILGDSSKDNDAINASNVLGKIDKHMSDSINLSSISIGETALQDIYKKRLAKRIAGSDDMLIPRPDSESIGS